MKSIQTTLESCPPSSCRIAQWCRAFQLLVLQESQAEKRDIVHVSVEPTAIICHAARLPEISGAAFERQALRTHGCSHHGVGEVGAANV